MTTSKLFFIYVAKNIEWKERQQEDWNYVLSMSRFYHWWVKRYFDIDLAVQADLLPVIPGKLFDRMSVSYLARDHSERGSDVYHFYLAYFKPLWTDCNTQGYSGDNFGMSYWQRPPTGTSEVARYRFFADNNCQKVSHVLAHKLLKAKGKGKPDYFKKVHEVWDLHTHGELPFLYFNARHERTSHDPGNYEFVTLDVNKVR